MDDKKSMIAQGVAKLLKTKRGKYVAAALVLVLVVLILLIFKPLIFGNQRKVTSKMTELGLKNIGELATQAGYFTNIQQIKDNKSLFGVTIPLTTSNHIFSYDGTIKAGIDFADVELDVNEEKKIVTVKIPPMKVLSCQVREDSLVIYEAKNNIFSPLSVEAMNESLKAITVEAEEKAIANGFLEAARQNAEILIKGFLSGAYNQEEYTFVFVDGE